MGIGLGSRQCHKECLANLGAGEFRGPVPRDNLLVRHPAQNHQQYVMHK